MLRTKSEPAPHSPAYTTNKSTETLNALLGHGSTFEGKLVFDGTVRIDGKFKGDIYSEHTLIIGETAIVEGTINVGHVMVSGQFSGKLVAKTKVEAYAPARLSCTIETSSLKIEDGVLFNGNCTMTNVEQPALSENYSIYADEDALDSASPKSPRH